MKGNCILFAVALWIRRRPRKRTLRLRRSRFGSLIPHMLYVEKRWYGERVIHFVPKNPRFKRIPPPIFDGQSKWGDL